MNNKYNLVYDTQLYINYVNKFIYDLQSEGEAKRPGNQ